MFGLFLFCNELSKYNCFTDKYKLQLGLTP